MNRTSPTRELLRPIAEHYYHDGAQCVPLSPTAGTRNAVILYEAFQGMSDKAILRADYNALGKPYAYFAGKDKKFKNTNSVSKPYACFGSAGKKLSNINVANINAERAELQHILSSIGNAAMKKFEGNIHVYSAVIKLRMLTTSRTLARDFHVGDVREPLGVIATAYETSGIFEKNEKEVSKNRSPEPRSPELRDQRLRQFIKYLSDTPHALSTMIKMLESSAEKDEFAATEAMQSVKYLIKDFLDLRSNKKISYQSLRSQKPSGSPLTPEKKSLTAFVKRQSDNPHLQLFAKLWNRMNQNPNLRGIVSIHSWARELTIIADLMLENSQGGTAASTAMPKKNRAVYQKSPLGTPATVKKNEYSLAASADKYSEKKSFLRIPDTPEDEYALQVALDRAKIGNDIDSPYKAFLPSSQQHISGYLLEKSAELESLEEAPRQMQVIATAPSASLLPPASLTKRRVVPIIARNPGMRVNVEKSHQFGTQASPQLLPSQADSLSSPDI